MAVPAMDIRVASNLASFDATGAGTSGHPLGFALPVAPPDVAAGCPAPWHLQALPAMDIRVAPNFASFDAPSGEAPGCPSASVHPSRLSMSPELPRLSHLPALPAMDIRVAPNLASFSASVA